jgi:hypothetical protein
MLGYLNLRLRYFFFGRYVDHVAKYLGGIYEHRRAGKDLLTLLVDESAHVYQFRLSRVNASVVQSYLRQVED